ncbi:SET domain-containing protein [Annulohypoxylon maeteangense]|uniref:SET domain-containing protein n=1 Tax=Annulohypoxylon maeteangense TaxID=1927788 RepID=UPI002007C0CF|nr:SET domain-containing protein [Annulohypoxylon maeteangense]KAI0883926.1 SET domain-containing protein [Annulohypoxylon maeteangense]
MKYCILILALRLVYVAAEAQKAEVPDWLKEYNFDPPGECSSDPAGPLNPRESKLLCPLPVDDKSAFEKRSWHPWTYPPMCMEAENETDPKLCVYTYSKLRGDLGISLITTPETAASGIGILEDPDPKWEEWVRGIPLTVSDPPPYEVVDLKDKGMGVVANRTIRKDEVVMLRHPVIVRILDPRPWKPKDVMKLLHRATVQLPQKQGLEMLKLAHSKGGYIIDDIINTNAFGVLVDGVDHSGLYVDVARLNHACKPNMFSRFSSTTLGMEVVAYRDIAPGEELTFSYLPLNLASEQRQTLIREWGFNCSCSLCASPDDTALSDRRRGRIQELLAELDDPDVRKPGLVKKRIDEILDLCEKEGLAAQIGDFYTIAAEVYLSMGDIGLARRYGELAVGELRHYAGYDHERTKSATSFLEKLRREESV